MCFVTSSLVGKYIHKVTSIIWSIMMSIYHHFRLNYISKMFKTSKIMYVLDKFIKHASYDGSLIIRAPFNIQVSYYNITQEYYLKS